ncbi:MAG: ABC transporter permease [Anaerolineaceae bacterium]|nr:ABC transporter permease [Anaerolineaceae bacterium]
MNKESKIKEIWTAYLDKSFSITVPLAAILLAFLVSGIIMLIWGANPLEAYEALFAGAFGSPNAFATTLERTTPLIFTGLAVTLGYRCGFFNVGAEGQLYMGAIAAIWVGIMLPNLTGWILIPLAALASAFMGVLWISIPAFLKAKRGINEVLTTLLMNYIAIQYFEWEIRVDHFKEGVLDYYGNVPEWGFLNYFIGLKDPTQPYPKTPLLTDNTFMPSLKRLMELPFVENLFGNMVWYQEFVKVPAIGRMTLTPVLGLITAGLLFFLLFRTVTGYKARAVGINPAAAKFMGINVPNTLLTTALISGALGGLAGGMEVLGTQHRVIPNFLVSAGFDGIPVALIGGLHPFGALLSAVFFGALRAGSNRMQVVTTIPVAVVYIIQALAILFAIAGTTIDFQAILKKNRLKRAAAKKAALEAAHAGEGEASRV